MSRTELNRFYLQAVDVYCSLGEHTHTNTPRSIHTHILHTTLVYFSANDRIRTFWPHLWLANSVRPLLVHIPMTWKHFIDGLCNTYTIRSNEFQKSFSTFPYYSLFAQHSCPWITLNHEIAQLIRRLNTLVDLKWYLLTSKSLRVIWFAIYCNCNLVNWRKCDLKPNIYLHFFWFSVPFCFVLINL